MALLLSYNAHEGATGQDPIKFGGTGIVLSREAAAHLIPFGLSSDQAKLGRWTTVRIMGRHSLHLSIFSVHAPTVTTRRPFDEPGDTVHEQHERYLASQA